MRYKQSNTPAPDDLLMTAREALKSVLADPAGEHSYTILMAMNAMGIAARAMGADTPPPVHPDLGDRQFKSWVRDAGQATILEPGMITRLRQHVEAKLVVSNPRFKPEQPQDKP